MASRRDFLQQGARLCALGALGAPLSAAANKTELEPPPDLFDAQLLDLDFWVNEARSTGVTMAVNIRVVDTNQRAMPADLGGEHRRAGQVADAEAYGREDPRGGSGGCGDERSIRADLGVGVATLAPDRPHRRSPPPPR